MPFALCQYDDIDREVPAYEPNPLVYTMLCEVLGVPVTDKALDLRIETSRHTFQTAIRK